MNWYCSQCGKAQGTAAQAFDCCGASATVTRTTQPTTQPAEQPIEHPRKPLHDLYKAYFALGEAADACDDRRKYEKLQEVAALVRQQRTGQAAVRLAEVAQGNARKISARYGHKFSREKAAARDLERLKGAEDGEN